MSYVNIWYIGRYDDMRVAFYKVTFEMSLKWGETIE